MGGSTFAIGLVPDYNTIGVVAPLHRADAPAVAGSRARRRIRRGRNLCRRARTRPPHRGYYTSWIQTTATLGLFVSLGVILGCRLSMGEDKFRIVGLARAVHPVDRARAVQLHPADEAAASRRSFRR
jgi:hypothetical protein